MIVACTTHLSESLAFGAPPLVMITALVAFTVRARRRDSASRMVDG